LTEFQKKKLCPKCLTADTYWDEYMEKKREVFVGSSHKGIDGM